MLVTENNLFQPSKRQFYMWTSPNGQYQNQVDDILCSQRWRNSIPSAETRPGVDCGSDHERLIARFRLNLKKPGKTPRPFRYDLNQIPYDYTVEVIHRFKGLDRIDRVSEHCTGGSDHNHPKEKERKQSGCLRRLYKQLRKERGVKGKAERERYTQLNTESPRIAMRDKMAILTEQCREIEENNRMRNTKDFFKKIGDIKGTFHARMSTRKDRNGKDLIEAEEMKERWQEYTELYQKGLNDLDNHDDVVTHLEPDILECEVKWVLEEF